MQPIVDPSDSPDLKGLSAEQLLKVFARYEFRDSHGHLLENCQDFLTLIDLATQGKQAHEYT
ncbi:hypothetical protein [Candidatus Sororendozoicomonas aggregata]|uniref:hypothetical protein n=1 Tax=Candidatus Sororendozoicomonas aggregata TaxID=3073239 RepID=UPI002ED6BAE9